MTTFHAFAQEVEMGVFNDYSDRWSYSGSWQRIGRNIQILMKRSIGQYEITEE